MKKRLIIIGSIIVVLILTAIGMVKKIIPIPFIDSRDLVCTSEAERNGIKIVREEKIIFDFLGRDIFLESTRKISPPTDDMIKKISSSKVKLDYEITDDYIIIRDNQMELNKESNRKRHKKEIVNAKFKCN